ncbi:MAG TPA: hypothetical protein PKA53_03985 [Sphingobacterium sp.]|nr:hypothetical protein [Sphingobacterium sp.]
MKVALKYIVLFACCMLFHSFGEREKMVGKEYTFQILPQSFIIINGSSNVNKFSCRVNRPADVTPLKLNIQRDYSVKMNGSIKVNVGEFDCKHRVLTSDLRKTLKEDVHKQMTVYFASLDQLPLDSRKAQTINGTVLIELAGVKKAFSVPLVFIQIDDENFQLKGSRSFSFEDFSLEPPKKVGGMIKVKNDFNTTFVLNLKQS